MCDDEKLIALALLAVSSKQATQITCFHHCFDISQAE